MTEVSNYEEIDLSALFSVLLGVKVSINFLTSAAAVLSVVYALFLPNIYQSSALLAPTKDSSSGIGGLLNQYSGLASMAGVSLPGAEGVSETQLAIEVINRELFAREFINKHQILPELFAIDHWDAGSGELVFDSDIYDVESGSWLDEDTNTDTSAPTDQEAFKAFRDILGVGEDKLTNLVTISIRHQSPEIARRWVEWLVQDINETMRQKEIKEAQQSIEYLKKQAAGTSLADLDQVFLELMQGKCKE